MNAKHTPPPWETDLVWVNPGHNHHILYVHNGKGEVVAQCWLTDVGGDFEARKRVTEANARLIAAAPELVAAMEQIQTWGEAGVIERRDTTAGTYWGITTAISDLARAALAKVRGESQANGQPGPEMSR